MQDEESRIEARVQERLAAILAEQQVNLAETMEQAIKEALKGIDQLRAELEAEHNRLQAEIQAAHELHMKADREGELLASAAFEKHQRQYTEAIRTSLLRDLTRLHLEGGKTTHEIIKWLEVDRQFVERIREVVERVQAFRKHERTVYDLEGNPRIRLVDEGRSGLLFFECADGAFDTWWEMGYGALAIVAVPTREHWETETGLPLERRAEILNFIGYELLRRQAPDGSFIVGENVLTVYAETDEPRR